MELLLAVNGQFNLLEALASLVVVQVSDAVVAHEAVNAVAVGLHIVFAACNHDVGVTVAVIVAGSNPLACAATIGSVVDGRNAKGLTFVNIGVSAVAIVVVEVCNHFFELVVVLVAKTGIEEVHVAVVVVVDECGTSIIYGVKHIGVASEVASAVVLVE